MKGHLRDRLRSNSLVLHHLHLQPLKAEQEPELRREKSGRRCDGLQGIQYGEVVRIVL